MSVTLDRIRARLERHKTLFDLSRDDLGRRLCKAATDGVQECIAGQHAPDGSAWAPLSEAYDEWKGYQFPGQPMAVLHGTMANPNEVAGEVAIAGDRATVTYGISDQARDEAYWFQEGNGRGQPPRPFWGFTSASLAEVKRILDAQLAKV